MQLSKRHHVVTRWLQARWAVHGSVLVIDKETRVAQLRQPTNNWVVSHFNSVRLSDGTRDDTLEREWSSIEGPIAAAVEARVRFGVPRTRADDARLLELVAIHAIRSKAIAAMHDDVAQQVVPDLVQEMVDDGRLQDMYRREHGRSASARDLDEIAQDLMSEHRRTNDLRVSRMVDLYNHVVQELSSCSVQLVRTRGLSLLLGDVPVVPVQGVIVGVQHGVGILSAEELRLPIAPNLGLVVSRRQVPDAWLSPEGVQIWNHATWRNSMTHVIATPALPATGGWQRLLGWREDSANR